MSSGTGGGTATAALAGTGARWRRLVVIVVALLGVVGLAGCGSSSAVSRSTPSAGSRLSPEQSKQQVMDLYDAIVKITGGKWSGGGNWQDCSPDPVDGPKYADFSFYAQRYKQPLNGDPDVVAAKVRDAMRKLGFKVRVQHDTQLTPTRTVIGYPGGYLQGTEADGFGFQFSADPNYADFQMNGHCVRGDSYFLETGKHSYED